MHFRRDTSEERFCFIKDKAGRHGKPKEKITSFTFREIDGHDEIKALKVAKARGLDGSLDEQIRLSIVAVNDQPVDEPYDAYDLWTSRARKLLLSSWLYVNAIDEDGKDSTMEGKLAEVEAPGGGLQV